jgi:hypothetical protein
MTFKTPKICYQTNITETPQTQNSEMADTAGLDTRHNITPFWNNSSTKIFTRASETALGELDSFV